VADAICELAKRSSTRGEDGECVETLVEENRLKNVTKNWLRNITVFEFKSFNWPANLGDCFKKLNEKRFSHLTFREDPLAGTEGLPSSEETGKQFGGVSEVSSAKCDRPDHGIR
jgi:hypothetical protein